MGLNKEWIVKLKIILEREYEVNGQDEDEAYDKAEAEAISDYGEEATVKLVDAISIEESKG